MAAGNVERRSMGALGRMGVVAGMHVAVFFLIARSLGIVPPLLPPDDIKVVPIDATAPPDEAPAQVAPTIVNPPIHVPPPDDPSYEPPAQETSIAALPIDPGVPVAD